MNPSICILVLCCLTLAKLANSQAVDSKLKQNVTDEVHLITKSLDDLLGELNIIKREATGRLSNVKNRVLTTSDQERIRQTKVSKFVLKRVVELETESQGMRDELSKLFNLQGQAKSPQAHGGETTRFRRSTKGIKQNGRQQQDEDQDFDDATELPSTTTSTQQPAASSSSSKPQPATSEGMPATTAKPTTDLSDEAAKLGFDVEALKKLGEEIGKRLDQFGKDAAKNLNDLIEGVKLVFREPAKGGNNNNNNNNNNANNGTNPNNGNSSSTVNKQRPKLFGSWLLLKLSRAELEGELEARQRQNPETLRGVHEQVIKLVDNMVQVYLGSIRRTIQRMTNLIENRRFDSQPRTQENNNHQLAPHEPVDPQAAIAGQFVDGFAVMRQSILDRIQLLSKRMHDFTMQWTRAVGKQQSPLIDRIPPRGVELWRDFWDTVRKQVRRINQEFWQLSQDMTRMLTGRLPISRPPPGAAGNPNLPSQPAANNNLFYSLASGAVEQQLSPVDGQQVVETLQDFYSKLNAALNLEHEKLDSLNGIVKSAPAAEQQPTQTNKYLEQQQQLNNNLIDEQDDEQTRNELNRNVALRQQIAQEISIFGSIFDIMRAFIQRLRESAGNAVRDVMQPGASNNNNNDPVTPGPSVKPQVDKLLGETIESQRIINAQSRPALLPNKRPTFI